MPEHVSVDEALARGHKMVTYTGVLALFGGLGLTFFLGIKFAQHVWIWPAGLVTSLALPWLVWSLQVTKWKVWAFSNVRNVHELKRRAIREKLIWDDKSFFNRTEIWKATDKEKWKLLELKFRRKDELVFEEDLTVPYETIIYYARGKNYAQMFMMVLFSGAGIYLLLHSDSYILGGLVFVMGLFMVVREFRQANNTDPQITLNGNGIETVSTPFYSWEDVTDEDVDMVSSGRSTEHYLVYNHPEGSEHLQIDDYGIEAKELRRLLRLYRGRSMKRVASVS